MNYQLTNSALASQIVQTRRAAFEARAAQHRLARECHGITTRSDSGRAAGLSLAALLPAAAVHMAVIR